MLGFDCKAMWKGKKNGQEQTSCFLIARCQRKLPGWLILGALRPQMLGSGIQKGKLPSDSLVMFLYTRICAQNHDTYMLKSVLLCIAYFFAAPCKLVDVSQPAMGCVCVCVCARTRLYGHTVFCLRLTLTLPFSPGELSPPPDLVSQPTLPLLQSHQV